MKRKLMTMVAVTCLTGVFGQTAQAAPLSKDPAVGDAEQAAQELQTREQTFLFLLTGRQDVFQCDVPPTDLGTTTADCHHHDIVDLRTGKVIGSAIDSSTDAELVGEEIVVTGTTFFSIEKGPFKGAKLTLRGRGAIAPHPVPNVEFAFAGIDLPVEKAPITHFAAITPIAGVDNNVLEASGRLQGARGTFALWGQLDLSQLPDNAAFNCIYNIRLNLPRRH